MNQQTLIQAIRSQRNAQKLSEFEPLPRGMALRSLAECLSSFLGHKNLIWFVGSHIEPGTRIEKRAVARGILNLSVAFSSPFP